MKYWHFMSKDRKLGYGDNRKAVKGRWLEHDGPLELSQSGLHASQNIMDALKYAPGPIICRVQLGGTILPGYDKSVAQKRKIDWWVDGEKLLRIFKFSCMCALDVIHLCDAPDIVVKYLQTQDEKIRDAACAACAARAAWDARDARDARAACTAQEKRLLRLVYKEQTIR